jgi:D-alanyl-lipoteichoic acid acyltransferase DltB (MBOAT superfamily)
MIAVTSPGFVLFAALLAGLWYVCPPPRRWQLLLGANLLFYAVLCPAALPVLAGSSFLVWWCGRRTAKKPVFLAGLAAALLPLALLKYLPAALGWQGTLANALGIGYFTLQLVSYLCDVRRGRILPEEKYARLLCYASFFLSITQGPFNRYDALMPQLDRPTVWDTDRVWRGVQRSAWGYFKKLAVADRAAIVVDAVFANPAAFDRTQLLLGGVLFTVQLYADFSGYTDIVLGGGKVLDIVHYVQIGEETVSELHIKIPHLVGGAENFFSVHAILNAVYDIFIHAIFLSYQGISGTLSTLSTSTPGGGDSLRRSSPWAV